ncbi:type 1 fimbrial protein [Escherichia coli]|nr:type 1 fimbrial protein [Escherichia coli]
MFRPFLDSLMLGSMFFLLLPSQEAARKGRDPLYGQIVEPACDVSTQSSPVEMNCPQNGSVPGRTYSSKALMSGNVKNAQIASVKVQYLDKQKKLAVMNIEYN